MFIETLRYALSLRRPYGSVQEGRLIAYLERPELSRYSFLDTAGNLHVDLRKKHTKTLFVAHVDTVHYRAGKQKVIGWDTGKLRVAGGGVLGADDGAGVAILAGMMHHRIPGYYLFTRGEEVGGIGANHVADEMPDLLCKFRRAITFDRADTYEVITHQAGGRCASDEFAFALSDELSADERLLYAPSDRGVYTDTAEFVDFIPECTNIGCGYYRQHTQDEWLDLNFLTALYERALKLDWESLPTKRNPMEFEVPDLNDPLEIVKTWVWN